MPKAKSIESRNENDQRVYTVWRVHSQRGHPGFSTEAEAFAYAQDPANGAFRIDEEVTTVLWWRPEGRL